MFHGTFADFPTQAQQLRYLFQRLFSGESSKDVSIFRHRHDILRPIATFIMKFLQFLFGKIDSLVAIPYAFWEVLSKEKYVCPVPL